MPRLVATNRPKSRPRRRRFLLPACRAVTALALSCALLAPAAALAGDLHSGGAVTPSSGDKTLVSQGRGMMPVERHPQQGPAKPPPTREEREAKVARL